jgi:hypothetical protein
VASEEEKLEGNVRTEPAYCQKSVFGSKVLLFGELVLLKAELVSLCGELFQVAS